MADNGAIGGGGVGGTGLDIPAAGLDVNTNMDQWGLDKPIGPGEYEVDAGSVAATIGTRTAAGLSSGTAINFGWGTLIGGVVGLLEGIFESAFRGKAAREEHESALDQFNKKMRQYYANIERYRQYQLKKSKESEEDKKRNMKENDRLKKLTAIMQGVSSKEARGRAAVERWM